MKVEMKDGRVLNVTEKMRDAAAHIRKNVMGGLFGNPESSHAPGVLSEESIANIIALHMDPPEPAKIVS